MNVEEVRETILKQINYIALQVGNKATYNVDLTCSEMVKNLAIAYKLLKEEK